MSWKSEKVSMPMSSAGILGISSDMETSGIKMEPKTIVLGIIVFIVLIKVLSFVIKV